MMTPDLSPAGRPLDNAASENNSPNAVKKGSAVERIRQANEVGLHLKAAHAKMAGLDTPAVKRAFKSDKTRDDMLDVIVDLQKYLAHWEEILHGVQR
jgi:hypothetical protein